MDDEALDSVTTARLERLGVGTGWQCLDVGAGRGSITRWLRDRVGSTGRVVALDLRAGAADEGIEWRQGDILTDVLEADTFDLVHCRAVLHHLPGRQDVALARMVAALKPGGLLVASEPYLGAMFASPTPAWAEMWKALDAALPTCDHTWAVAVPAALHAAGLVDIEADAQAEIVQGATPPAAFLRELMEAFRERIPAEIDIDAGLALLLDPNAFEPGYVWYTAAGRRPRL